MVACEVAGWLCTLPSPSCPARSLWQDMGNDSCQLSNCSTVAGRKHNPLTHVWLQVLFNQVLPTFLPLLIWSHFVPCLHRANSMRSRSSQEPSLATGQQQQSSNTLCPRFPMLSWKTRSPANSSLSKGPALSWRNCNSQVFFFRKTLCVQKYLATAGAPRANWSIPRAPRTSLPPPSKPNGLCSYHGIQELDAT